MALVRGLSVRCLTNAPHAPAWLTRLLRLCAVGIRLELQLDVWTTARLCYVEPRPPRQ